MGASSIATLRVRPMTPDLAALYCALPGHEVFPAMDEMLMIGPAPVLLSEVAATALLVRGTPRSGRYQWCAANPSGTSTSGWPV